MENYYREKLASSRLRKCYEVAPPRVRQYLEAEVSHVLKHVKSTDLLLDLGCGYGRVLPLFASKARKIVGIDSSFLSLKDAREDLTDISNCSLATMNAKQLGFQDKTFDVVVCIQNGISAFHVNQRDLIVECLRVVKPDGILLFSTYAEKFWEHRLEWFERQYEAGVLGEIDYGKTGNGIIICKDGFKATTVSPEQFKELTSNLDAKVDIVEVDESSLFCEIRLIK